MCFGFDLVSQKVGISTQNEVENIWWFPKKLIPGRLLPNPFGSNPILKKKKKGYEHRLFKDQYIGGLKLIGDQKPTLEQKDAAHEHAVKKVGKVRRVADSALSQGG